jgi:hypothetical protein
MLRLKPRPTKTAKLRVVGQFELGLGAAFFLGGLGGVILCLLLGMRFDGGRLVRFVTSSMLPWCQNNEKMQRPLISTLFQTDQTSGK